jgi:cbb3-type cytochrome oxidase subunit 3
MKLAKHYLNQVAFADQLQSIAFVIFFILFLIILVWIITGEKKMYLDNGNMPLEDNDFVNNFENNNKTD